MSNLKSLVARSNEGLSFGKKSKQRFGLGSFVAASTDQMLMTRGGYGSPQNYYSGPESWWDAPGGGGGGSSSANPYNPVAGVGGNIAQGMQNSLGDVSRSVGATWDRFSQGVSNVWNGLWDNAETTATIIDAANTVSGPPSPHSFLLMSTLTAPDQRRVINDSIRSPSGANHGPANP